MSVILLEWVCQAVMLRGGALTIEFVATVAVIAQIRCTVAICAARDWDGSYSARMGATRTAKTIPRLQSFGIWSLSQAARAWFGARRSPAERPISQVSVEFDVPSADAVAPAARELIDAGHDPLHEACEEPWGQTVARLQSPEGAIIGVAHTPVLHD
jgi:hypothetical protein